MIGPSAGWRSRLAWACLIGATLAGASSCAMVRSSVWPAGRDAICIVQDGASRKIADVSVASTPKQRARGLQGRQSMPPNAGMWFDFERDQIIEMWMKSTPLSLDMIFVNEALRVVHIEYATTPNSYAILTSKTGARYVLEMPAGAAQREAIRVGDMLRHAPDAAC